METPGPLSRACDGKEASTHSHLRVTPHTLLDEPSELSPSCRDSSHPMVDHGAEMTMLREDHSAEMTMLGEDHGAESQPDHTASKG